MDVKVGDHLVVRSHAVAQADRSAEVLEVIDAKGEAHYRVRWTKDGHEGIFFPGPDTLIDHIRKGAKKNR
jgi:hypothetical protein